MMPAGCRGIEGTPEEEEGGGGRGKAPFGPRTVSGEEWWELVVTPRPPISPPFSFRQSGVTGVRGVSEEVEEVVELAEEFELEWRCSFVSNDSWSA